MRKPILFHFFFWHCGLCKIPLPRKEVYIYADLFPDIGYISSIEVDECSYMALKVAAKTVTNDLYLILFFDKKNVGFKRYDI